MVVIGPLNRAMAYDVVQRDPGPRTMPTLVIVVLVLLNALLLSDTLLSGGEHVQDILAQFQAFLRGR